MSENTYAVLVCEPQREAGLAGALTEAHYEVFAPTYVSWRGRHSRYTEIRRPLINGYLFAVMQPHEVHAFHAKGAIRLLPMTKWQSAAVSFTVQEWSRMTEEGAFDEARPGDAKSKPAPSRRNRKARRQAGEAKRETMKLKEGLEAILSEMTNPQPIAA